MGLLCIDLWKLLIAPWEATVWGTKGVTHVLFYRQGYHVIWETGFDPLTDGDAATVDVLCRHHMQAVQTFGDAYVLYELAEP